MTSIRDRYRAALITVADLRQDLLAQEIGLATDFSPEGTERYLKVLERKLADLKAAYLANPGGEA
jgi:hypothetical protein